MLDLLLIAHLLATAMMTGLMWFVQIVHYPLFTEVGNDSFTKYELLHQNKTSWVVGPLMLVEGLSAIAILFFNLDNPMLPLTGLLLLACVHTSTLFLQVPKHRRLGSGFDATTVSQLVKSNWIRTVGWSARTIIAALVLTNY